MLNNYCEEMNAIDSLLKFQEKSLGKAEIPKWMNLKCPYCHKDLPLRSIRSVAMRFNTRNLGDVTVEIFCIYCNKMDTMYFRQEATTISDFISLLKGDKEPHSKPVLEEEMYNQKYNNAMDRMMSEIGRGRYEYSKEE